MYMLLYLLVILYIGYVLVWGSMSYWGVIVISNMFKTIPCIMELLCGNFICCYCTIDRYIMFHMFIVSILIVYIVIHTFYIHCYNMVSSDIDMIGMNINGITSFTVLIISMDIVIVYIVLILVFMYCLM